LANTGAIIDYSRTLNPWLKFGTMLENMDDCFLSTYICEKLRKRLN